MDEVHAPALGRTDRHRRRPSVQRDVLPSPDAHPQLQPLEAIQPTDALPIHHPAFSTQEHPDAQEPESRPGVRELADPHPQRGLVLRAAAAIPRRPTELRQMTGPHAADGEGHLDPAGQLAALCGPQTFFRSASDRMCLSSERSATRRFSRPFSSSSDRSRRSSLTPRCAYFFFQM